MMNKIFLITLFLFSFFVLFGCTGADTFIINQTKLTKLFDGNISGDAGLIPFLNFDGNKLEVSSGFDFNSDTNTLSTNCLELGDGNTYCSSTDFPNPDLSGYFLLDQTTPQTIINGAPIFSKGLKVNADNEKIIMGAENDSEEYFDGSNQIHKTAGYHYFYTNASKYPVTIGTYSGVNKITSTIGLSIMSAKIPSGVDTGLYLDSSSDLINFYTGGSVKLKLSSLSGSTAFYPNADKGLSLGGTTKRFYKGFFANSISNYADNSKHFWGAANDASITYDGTNLVVNPKEVGSGIVYVDGNISAVDFITRTEVYDKSKGSALDFVKDSSELISTIKGESKIDHSQFYGYTQIDVEDKSKPVVKQECLDKAVLDEKGNAMFDEKGVAVTEEVCEDVIYYPYTVKEDGVSVVAEVEMLRQALYELKIELCNYNNDYSWCEIKSIGVN